MTDPELGLWDELGAIDARREKLKDTLDRLSAKRGFTKAPSFADSGVDLQSKVHDTSLEELTRKRVTETQRTKQPGDQTEQRTPGYLLYGPEERESFKLPRPGTSTTRPLFSAEEHMTRYSTPRVSWDTSEADRVLNDVKRKVSKDIMPPLSQSSVLNSTVSSGDGDAHGKTIMKPATFDGTGSWIDYKAHFEACCNINSWSTRQKGLYLAASLRGQAQTVLGNMKSEDVCAYGDLCEALEARFAPANQIELYRAMLREKRQKPKDTLPELGESIRRLVHLAYPTAPREVTEMIAKDQFVDALNDFDMRLRIQQSRPRTLNDAVRLAVEIEAFCRAERQRRQDIGFARGISNESKDLDSSTQVNQEIKQLREELKSSLKVMEDKIAQLTLSKENTKQHDGNEFTSSSRRSGYAFPYKCHNCGKRGHKAEDCYFKKKPSPRKREYVRSQPMEQSEKRADNKAPKTASGTITQTRVDIQSGLFTKATVNRVPCSLLVDTGATMTIFSHAIFEKIERSRRNELTPVKQEIVLADGTPLQVKGRCQLQISLGTFSFTHDVVIADISTEGILGLDFLKQHKCLVDVSLGKLYVGGMEHELQLQGHLGCFNVSLKETITIPPMSEMICPGRLLLPSDKIISEALMVEANERFQKSGKALVARSLINAKEDVALRLMNVSSQPQTVYKNTLVGKTSAVTNVMDYSNQSVEKNFEDTIPGHLKELYAETTKDLSAEQALKTKKVLLKYQHIFSKSEDDFGKTSLIKHKINTENAKPTKQPPRRLPHHAAEFIDQKVDNMIQKGIVEPSTSPWASGVVLVEKKDGTKRFCVDYRSLNSKTVKDAYPLPRIDDSLDRLRGATWFCTLDLHSGYWQVEMEESDKPKTAFATRNGLYQFTVMPFGLCNSPATFERLMETVLAGLNYNICLVYIDDIIVFGSTFEETLDNLAQVFGKLENAGLKLKAKKCSLFKKEVLFLGYIVSGKGVHTDPQKISAISNWPTPLNPSEVRSFVGLCSYYRRFIYGFSSLAKPLFKLTEKNREFKWTTDCQEAFEKLKNHLTTAPILCHPDFRYPFVLDTDASQFGLGAVLSQEIDGKTRVISYASRTLSKSERRYCVTRKELLAVVFGCKHFRHYLYGHKVIVRTDHSALRWLLNFKDPQGQVARWIEFLGTYDIEIRHRPGAKHCNADSLSRHPCHQCGFSEDWEKSNDHERRGSESKSIRQINAVSEDNETILKGIQNNDQDLSIVKNWVETKKRPGFSDIKHKSKVIKSLWSQWNHLEIQNDLLCWKWIGDLKVYHQIIVPLSERREILKECHDSKTSGHLGVNKTLQRVRDRFYWTGLQSDVRSYVIGCTQCRKRKNRSAGKSCMKLDQSGSPMERIATNIMGPLPQSEEGNKYILVIADYFTKWTEAFPLKNIEAQTVAKVKVEEFITRFGVPEVIHSDQGRQYESQLFQELCEMLGIRKTRTTAFHPKSDGMVERFNKTLATMLSAYVSDHQHDWDRHLPYVLMAYRSAQHESTGYSPNMLMLGREVSTPLDIMYELPKDMVPCTVHDYVWKLREVLETSHRHTRQYTTKSMLRQKKYHDQNAVHKQFEIGDQVLVFFPQRKVGKSPKLMSFWYGPYKIVGKHTDLTYKIQKEGAQKITLVHVDRIRSYGCQRLQFESQDESSPRNDSNCSIDPDRTVANDDDLQLDLLSNTDLNEIELEYFSRRSRRRPAWHSDYQFDYNV